MGDCLEFIEHGGVPIVDLTKKPYSLTQEESEQIHEVVANLSTEEKIGQLFFLIGHEGDEESLEHLLTTYKPGGMMFRPGGALERKKRINLVQKKSHIPLFVAANLESGGNGLLTDGTWVGMPLQIAATDHEENAYHLGAIAGDEASQVGCNLSFSPIIDIDYNFRNPITNTRTFGSDVERIARMVKAQVDGLNNHHVTPVLKHFPGDGVDERDQHLLTTVNSLSKEEWSATYGRLYQQFIDEGIPSIMVGHIMQPAWEKALRPEIQTHEHLPASVSSLLVDGLLRKEMGFNGLVITDATPMIGYNVVLPRKKLLPMTINAGVDMLLFNKSLAEDYQIIQEAVESGEISKERLDEAVLRIIGTKVSQKMMTPTFDLLREEPATLAIRKVEHQKIVEKIAKESVTLVKDTQDILPISPEKYPRLRLVVLGDEDGGGFKEGGKVTQKFQEGLEQLGFKVSLFNPKQLDFHEVFEEGVADLREKFDLALYIANVETASNQTTTRINWIQLMAANAPWFCRELPTIFVSTANPYHLFDVPYVSTFINAYTGNSETIAAVLRKITGKETFEGIHPIDPFCGDEFTKI